VTTKLSQHYPKRRVCAILGLARSSYYHRWQPLDVAALKAAIGEVSGEFPCYGYRRVKAELQRHGWTVGAHRVRRLMREMGLSVRKWAKKQYMTNCTHEFPRYANLLSETQITRAARSHADRVGQSLAAAST